MSFKTPILCDRRIYNKKGKWENPNNDIADNVFYFIKEPLTLSTKYYGGREELKETIVITCFGGKPYNICDKFVLEDGTEMEIESITVNYVEENILIQDMLKQRIESIDLVLE